MKKHLLFTYISAVIFLLLAACNNDDNAPEVIQEEEPEVVVVESVEDYPVQNFMWQAMNLFYFWQEEVPNLSDDKFTSLESLQYINFLASESDPTTFFFDDLAFNYNMVNGDRFSGINENYKELVNSLQGVSKSNGLEFNLYLGEDEISVYGVVTYIAFNSNAAEKDIQRGDIFDKVDGQNLDRNNFGELLFDNRDSYVLDLAEFIDDELVSTGESVTLEKIENFSENPILINKVIEQGDQSIGYLMYNGFLAAFDDELNEVFGSFSAQGIDELILDFRYNGGGRVSTAVQIASSVYQTDTTAIFLQPRLNQKLQGSGLGVADKFTDVTLQSRTPLNALGLNKVYIITSGRTASASELVINGLEPYVEVIQVGDVTVGKSEFSLTLVDDPEGFFIYNPEREQFINSESQWGLQPLIGKNANADGFSDYEDGLQPDYPYVEDRRDFGVLGEESDPLLALTLSVINGTTAKFGFSNTLLPEHIGNSKMFTSAANSMSIDGLLKPVKSLSNAK